MKKYVQQSKGENVSGIVVLFTPQQVAEMLNISRSHLYSLMAEKKIRSMTIGRSRRFSPEQVNSFVAELGNAS
jgi:excisionase family DNA binding protein